MDDFAPFAHLIEVLRPWLDRVVVVGGWAHRLHRFHPLSNPPAYLPLRTRDADVAFSLTNSIVGDIGAALRAAKFREELSGDHTPPVCQYRLGDEDQGFYVEFLAPLRGDGVRPNGEADATVTRAGVTAQKLRHVDLLLMKPWAVRFGTTTGVPLKRAADIMVANPVSFIAQKLLIQKHRKPVKRPQDALYIHDTLDLFGRELETSHALWREEIRPALAPRTARRVERLQREPFGAVTAVIGAAARIPPDRTISPVRMQAECAYGLEAVFGGG